MFVIEVSSSLADHPESFEQVGLLRWKEWAFGAQDLAPFIEVTAKEAGGVASCR